MRAFDLAHVEVWADREGLSRRVSADTIAKGTAEDHRETSERAGVALEIVEAEEPLWVDADRTRLAQVIGNLLSNAAKFTARGGHTVLRVEQVGEHAFLRVRDDGAGMSPETQAHLFQPFVQAAQTLERTRGGLGLGLALVRGLVELHGGTVTAHSEGEGKGSELVARLPAEDRAPRGPVAHEGLDGRPEPRRILVVEDNIDSAMTLRDALELDGHDVMVARTGAEGLEVARAEKPEVILCDLGLPEMDGYEVARSIRADADAELRQVFLVALSGYASPEDVARAREAGFDRHVAKPPSMKELVTVLAEARS